jgi:hypothetical protein
LIKEFFSESMINNKGEEISTIEVKKKTWENYLRRRQKKAWNRWFASKIAAQRRVQNSKKNSV